MSTHTYAYRHTSYVKYGLTVSYVVTIVYEYTKCTLVISTHNYCTILV